MNAPVESAGWISLKNASLLSAMLRSIGGDEAKFCAVLGIASIDQLQREHTNRAVLLIELINAGVSK
jgi:hypothetical protein